jgi:hypothetical protein
LPPRIRDASVLIDIGVHDIDMVAFITGARLNLIAARKAAWPLLDDRLDFATLLLDAAGCAYRSSQLDHAGQGARTLDHRHARLLPRRLHHAGRLVRARPRFAPAANYEALVAQYTEGTLIALPVEKREPLARELEVFINGVRGGPLPDPTSRSPRCASPKKPRRDPVEPSSAEPARDGRMQRVAASAFVHETALVEDGAPNSAPARASGIRRRYGRDARVGARCIVGKGAFVDFDVTIGDDSKLQNYACVYHGVTLGRGVFVGPHAVFTNDRRPRATVDPVVRACSATAIGRSARPRSATAPRSARTRRCCPASRSAAGR